MLSLVDSVLTSVNLEFTRVSMIIATRGLAEVILISGPSRDSCLVQKIHLIYISVFLSLLHYFQNYCTFLYFDSFGDCIF